MLEKYARQKHKTVVENGSKAHFHINHGSYKKKDKMICAFMLLQTVYSTVAVLFKSQCVTKKNAELKL